MSFQRIHNGVHQCIFQVGRIGEPLIAACRLWHQHCIFLQFALEDAIHIHELVVVGQFTYKQPIYLLDDFRYVRSASTCGNAVHRVFFRRSQLSGCVAPT